MPNDGVLLVTTPFNTIPFTQILPFASQSPISTSSPAPIGVTDSMKHPPMLVLERLPQAGVAEPLTWISTATKHLIRGYILRSCPQFGVKMSGSKGGGSAAGTTAAAAIAGLILAGMLSGRGAELGIDAAGVLFACPDLISRIASSSACSRCSGEASRYVFSSFPRWL